MWMHIETIRLNTKSKDKSTVEDAARVVLNGCGHAFAVNRHGRNLRRGLRAEGDATRTHNLIEGGTEYELKCGTRPRLTRELNGDAYI